MSLTKLPRLLALLSTLSLTPFLQAGVLTVSSVGDVSDLSDYTVSNTINYEMGVDVSAGTEFLYKVTLADSFVWGSGFMDSYLTISTDATANANASITIRSGGSIGSSFVEYRIILGGSAGDELTTGDVLSLTHGTSFHVTHASLGGLTQTDISATVEDDFGFFDESGNHSATFAQVSAVPEPSEYAAILGLISFIGIVIVRRRARRDA